jgi:nucleotidyltransferase/DNA polymerase involved in DNA repair
MERAIIHFDGDSFFASVEQVMNGTKTADEVMEESHHE